MAKSSLISDLLKSPSQIRAEEQEALRQKGLQRAALVRGSGGAGGSLFGGMFRDFAAQQAADVDTRTDQLKRSLGQLAGVDMRSTAEQQAAKQQEVLRGTQMNNLQSLKTRRQMFVDADAPAAALEALDNQIRILEQERRAQIDRDEDRAFRLRQEERAIAADARAEQATKLAADKWTWTKDQAEAELEQKEAEDAEAKANLKKQLEALRKIEGTGPYLELVETGLMEASDVMEAIRDAEQKNVKEVKNYNDGSSNFIGGVGEDGRVYRATTQGWQLVPTDVNVTQGLLPEGKDAPFENFTDTDAGRIVADLRKNNEDLSKVIDGIAPNPTAKERLVTEVRREANENKISIEDALNRVVAKKTGRLSDGTDPYAGSIIN